MSTSTATPATPAENTQATHTQTAADSNNSTGNGTTHGARHRNGNNNQRRNQSQRGQQRVGGIPSSFTGAQPTVNAVIGTRDENGPKNSFEVLQDAIMGYVSEKYSKGTDLAPLIRDLEAIDISGDEPDMVLEKDKDGKEKPAGIVQTKKFEMKLKSYFSRLETLEENEKKLFTLVLGQCTQALQQALEGHDEYTTKEREFDSLWLLVEIKKLTSGVEERNVSPYLAVYRLLRQFFNFRQGEQESNDGFLKRFLELNSSLKQAEINSVDHDHLATIEKKALLDEDNTLTAHEATKQGKSIASEALTAMVFLNSAKGNVFGPLLKELQNDMMKGNDNYPSTVTRAYDLLNRYETVNRQSTGRRNNTQTGGGGPPFRRAHQFTQDTREAPAGTVFTPGTDGSTLHSMRCYECGKWGHGRRNCPSRPAQSGTGLTQVGVCLAATHGGINDDWLLLDSCSTVSCMKNEFFVSKVTQRSLDDSLRVHTNGGHQDYRMTGTLKILPLEVYVNPTSMANIVSLKDVYEKYRVTMDTEADPSMLVHHEDGKAYRFKSCGKGLFHMSLTTPDIVNVTDKHNVKP